MCMYTDTHTCTTHTQYSNYQYVCVLPTMCSRSILTCQVMATIMTACLWITMQNVILYTTISLFTNMSLLHCHNTTNSVHIQDTVLLFVHITLNSVMMVPDAVTSRGSLLNWYARARTHNMCTQHTHTHCHNTTNGVHIQDTVLLFVHITLNSHTWLENTLASCAGGQAGTVNGLFSKEFYQGFILDISKSRINLFTITSCSQLALVGTATV